jgi:hypothetical protein
MGNYPVLININVLINGNGDAYGLKFKGSLISQPISGSANVVVLRSSELPNEIRLVCEVAEESPLKGYIWVVFKTIDPDPFSETHTPEEFSNLIINLMVAAGWEDCRDNKNLP